MKAALVINRLGADVDSNLAAMEDSANEAADSNAHLVLFSEAAPTGLLISDDPARDLALGEPIPGPVTRRLASVARLRGIYIATGILERERDCLYDAAVLLGPDGEIVLRYRRIHPGWHGVRADLRTYREGNELHAASTQLGSMLFLICGDLFDDAIVARAAALAPDYLLFPFARNFPDGSLDQARWNREEEAAYASRAAAIGCTALTVNALGDADTDEYPGFGGALVVSCDGEVVARWPLGKPGILYADA